MLKSTLSALGAFLYLALQAQPASVQDCLGAIPVCQQVYEENRAPVGNGSIEDFGASNNCTVGESHSIWYTFTVNNSGQFGFVLTPNDPNQDYDWIVFDITEASCEDIFNDPSLIVSCNAAGGNGCHGPTGATGASEYDEQGPNCNNFPPDMNNGFNPFNGLVAVEEGNTYALCIINFSSVSSRGYTLDFGLSAEVGIFDDTPPLLAQATYPNTCNGEEVTVRFSEYIQCATLGAANFQLIGPGGPYALSLSSANCDAGGGYSREFTLAVSPPISPQDSVSLELIVDGDTEALDLCGNPSLPASLRFGSPAASASLNLGPDTTLCDGEPLRLETGLDGAHSWSDGSTGPSLEISAPGVYWVEVSASCGTLSDTIQVMASEASPSVNLGNDTTLCSAESLVLDVSNPDATYRWEDGSTGPVRSINEAGTYAVTVTNACGEAQGEITVETASPITAELNDTSLCPGEEAIFNVSNPWATYLWQDGSTSPSFTATSSGTYAVTITNACEVVELSAEVQETAAAIPDFSLGSDTTLCNGESLLLEVGIPGLAYQWQDGSSGDGYQLTEPGVYSVTVSNACTSRSDSIGVSTAGPITARLPADTVLCPGESLRLDVTDENAASYLWQDNSSQPEYLAKGPGRYTVLVSNECEMVTLSLNVEECEICSVYVPNAFSPNNDGRNDHFQPYTNCPVESFTLQIFNRWGALVFESSSMQEGWDGTFKGQAAGGGVYLYTLQMSVLENGKTRDIQLGGDINLSR